MGFKTKWTLAGLTSVGVAFAACNLVVDPGSYSVSDDAGAKTDSAVGADTGAAETDTATAPVDSSTGCIDEAGFGGKGCYSCPPTTTEDRENACTGSQCSPFDERKLPTLDGGVLPPLPSTDSAPPPDTAPTPDTTPTPDASDTGPVDTGPTFPKCSSLSGGNVVYATGSSAVTLFLGRIAQALENTSPPVTVVYQSAGSCVGISAAVNPGSQQMTGTAIYWDPNPIVDPTSASAQLTCTLDGPTNADIGFSDVFPQSCLSLPGGLDKSLHDFFGPVQTMTLTVPQNSDEQTISAQAAYLVYGFGGASPYQVTPWNDPAFIFQRNASSGTQAMIAAAINVPATRWFGKSNKGSGDVRDALIAAGSAGKDAANKAIGPLSADFTDALRDKLRILGFQDYKQKCAFWPDSTPKSFDKRNVRDGHYPIWSPLHMLAHVDLSTIPVKAAAQRLIGIIAGNIELPKVDTIGSYAASHLIPLCAMTVTREQDGGEIKSFKPDKSCSCYFEEKSTAIVPPPGCKTCAGASDCGGDRPNCNKFEGQTTGYCEP